MLTPPAALGVVGGNMCPAFIPQVSSPGQVVVYPKDECSLKALLSAFLRINGGLWSQGISLAYGSICSTLKAPLPNQQRHRSMKGNGWRWLQKVLVPKAVDGSKGSCLSM